MNEAAQASVEREKSEDKIGKQSIIHHSGGWAEVEGVVARNGIFCQLSRWISVEVVDHTDVADRIYIFHWRWCMNMSTPGPCNV